MKNKHEGQDCVGEKSHNSQVISENLEHNSEEISESIDLDKTQENVEERLSLEKILKDLGLENLLINFVSEGVDIDMLTTMDHKNLKECLSEIGITRYGDRHRIIEKLLRGKKETSDSVNTLIDLSGTNMHLNVDESFNLNISLNKSIEISRSESTNQYNCVLCDNSKQHYCRKCTKSICNFCSVQDNDSSNEMHRMHKEGDKRCKIKEFEDLRSFEEYSCGMCKFISRSFTDLKNHKKVEHSGKNTEAMRNF